jgi:hypothetical protein
VYTPLPEAPVVHLTRLSIPITLQKAPDIHGKGVEALFPHLRFLAFPLLVHFVI